VMCGLKLMILGGVSAAPVPRAAPSQAVPPNANARPKMQVRRMTMSDGL
jgi:hypothetical protein